MHVWVLLKTDMTGDLSSSACVCVCVVDGVSATVGSNMSAKNRQDDMLSVRVKKSL